MVSRRAFLGAAAAVLPACSSKSQQPFVGYAFVANEDGNAIAVVDLTAFAVVRHIALPSAPTQLLNQPARGVVYALTPHNGEAHEISVSKLRRERWTGLGGYPLSMRANPRSGFVWLLTRDPHQLLRLRLDTFEVAQRIALPRPAHDFDISPREPRAVASLHDGAVAAIDLDSGKTTRVDTGAAHSTVRFRSDGRQWIAGHSGRNLLSVFDTNSNRAVVRLPLAMRPEQMCFKSDGGQLFVTGAGMDAVAVVYPYSTEVAQTVLAGHSPGPMAASPPSATTPEYLFVTNPASDQVTTIEIEFMRVVAVTQVGSEPRFVAVTPNNQYALVLNQRSGDMAVLLLNSASTRVRRFPPGLLTMIPVGSKPVSAVVQAV